MTFARHNSNNLAHPSQLHRHCSRLRKAAAKTTGGVIKDVAVPGGCLELEVDFTADHPGLTLFRCHMQRHMDFEFTGCSTLSDKLIN